MTISSSQHRRFLEICLVFLLSFLCFTAVFNYFIDPYGLFDTTRINGFNAVKPAAGSHVRIAKPYQVDSFAPRTIIAGNSRPEMGLNPDNDCWPEELRPVFNLGLPGASVYMQARTLQHAIAGNEVSLALWGLDFLDFLGSHKADSNPAKWPPFRASFEDRLRVNADGTENRNYPWKKLQDWFFVLFSLDTTKDSLRTLFAQGNHHASSIRRNGFNPALDYLDIIAWEGQGVLFQQKNQSVARMFSRTDLNLFHGNDQWSQEFESVRQLLMFTKKNNVKVILFINPYHADYLAALDLSGRWSQFEFWKRKLVEIAEELDVELWDFSGINSLSTEPAPKPREKDTQLQWFWEPAHYRREYGDLMLTKMLKKFCNSGSTNAPGVFLTKDNLDIHLVTIRSGIIGYKNEYPDSINKLRSYIPRVNLE